jgi:hypothetical protein
MDTPTPQGEILVVENYKPIILVIFFASQDVQAWATKEAPRFGTIVHEGHQRIHLVLNPLFKAKDVKSYLEQGYSK